MRSIEQVKKDIAGACGICAGSVALVNGRLGCAKHDASCVLPRLAQAVTEEHAALAQAAHEAGPGTDVGPAPICEAATTEWIYAHAEQDCPLPGEPGKCRTGKRNTE